MLTATVATAPRPTAAAAANDLKSLQGMRTCVAIVYIYMYHYTKASIHVEGDLLTVLGTAKGEVEDSLDDIFDDFFDGARMGYELIHME